MAARCLHTAGKLPRVRLREFLETHDLEQMACIIDVRVHLTERTVGIAIRFELSAELDVLAHGQPREQRVALKNHPAVPARTPHLPAINSHLPAGRLLEAGGHEEQR